MRYTIDLNDASEYGITAAREAFNSSLPATVDDAPNPALLATNADYVAYVLGSAVESWCRQYAPVVVPDVPKADASGVPQVITPAQGETQLLRDGLLDAVRAIVASEATPEEMKIAFARATEWQRTSPSVLAMMQELGKTDADADAFFAAASKL